MTIEPLPWFFCGHPLWSVGGIVVKSLSNSSLSSLWCHRQSRLGFSLCNQSSLGCCVLIGGLG
jgi:hypothetical protein